MPPNGPISSYSSLTIQFPDFSKAFELSALLAFSFSSAISPGNALISGSNTHLHTAIRFDMELQGVLDQFNTERTLRERIQQEGLELTRAKRALEEELKVTRHTYIFLFPLYYFYSSISVSAFSMQKVCV